MTTNKKLIMLGMTVGLSVASYLTAFAGQWQKNETGWWYQYDDGSFPVNTWEEIDGKQYYFDNNGYMLFDTTTPDGYKVGIDGAWINELQQGQVKQNMIASYGEYSINPLIFEEMNSTADELRLKYDSKINPDCYFLGNILLSQVDGTLPLDLENSAFDYYNVYSYTVPKGKEYKAEYDLNNDGVNNEADSILAYNANDKELRKAIEYYITDSFHYDWNKSPYNIVSKGKILVGFNDITPVEEVGNIVKEMGATNIEVENRNTKRKIPVITPSQWGSTYDYTQDTGYYIENYTNIQFDLNGLRFSAKGNQGMIDRLNTTWIITHIGFN